MATPKKAAKRGVKKPAKRRSDAPDPHAGRPPERARCAARTARGGPCRNYALEGSTLCAKHLNPRGSGRRTKFTPEIAEQIVSLLSNGGYAETAAVAAGISKTTFYEWIKRGDPAGTKAVDEPYRVFRAQIDQARAKAEVIAVEQIAAAGVDDWRARAWYLERVNPTRYGGPRSRNVSGGIHPDDFANGEPSSTKPDAVVDDQVGPDGRPL